MTQSLSQYMQDPANAFWVGVGFGIASASMAFVWATLKAVRSQNGGAQ